MDTVLQSRLANYEAIHIFSAIIVPVVSDYLITLIAVFSVMSSLNFGLCQQTNSIKQNHNL